MLNDILNLFNFPKEFLPLIFIFSAKTFRLNLPRQFRPRGWCC